MRFPFAPGSYGRRDVATLEDGTRTVVAGNPELLEWLTERGADPDHAYHVTTVPWFGSGRILGAIVWRYATDDKGRKRPTRFGTGAARTFPQWVSE